MVKLVAATEVYYSGRIRRPNEEFDATPVDARILKGTGKAKDAPQAYETRAMEPQPEPRPEPESSPESEQTLFTEGGAVEAAPSPKKKYRRRDMTAEDSSNG